MDKESKYLLQLIDCNCNDCKYMSRDLERLNAHKESFKGTGLMDSLCFGVCVKLGKNVCFIPNTCQIETQECFSHRKDFTWEGDTSTWD